ncbi:MAG: hypothetical protein Unbinned6224contig1000_41 [Prokaryotic dsDNA virus sp.]|nr:MAG: hypothetical protein Unbinned6224contig1000_41 [Prokaryotic dsDNA virus sp.]|tara:strand:- start:39547 stop:39753 length:207 start_codon:yes stop_codon:yes gene_type:complete
MGVQKNIGILKAKVESLTDNLQKLIIEEKQTRDMVLGALQILKEMPGHEKALKKLQEKFEKENGHKGA